MNDGHSLPMVGDTSIDFAFSFDSLVLVEADTLARYLSELARVLKPDGVAFLHHSNFGAYERSTRCPRAAARLLRPTAVFGPGRSLTIGDLPWQTPACSKCDRCRIRGPLRQGRLALHGSRTHQFGREGSFSSTVFL